MGWVAGGTGGVREGLELIFYLVGAAFLKGWLVGKSA